jgi:MYXO-CTERM domain-containing protein
VRTNNYGYQCVELGLRYFFFRWKVPHPWSPTFSSAYQMCTHVTAGVTRTTTPVLGDLVVYPANLSRKGCPSTLADGHVGVVNAIKGSTITVMNQNITIGGKARGAPYDWQLGCESCFLHAVGNVPICSTIQAPPTQVPTLPGEGLDFACGNSMRDTGATWIDWSNGYYKADCSTAQAATGLSMSKASPAYAHDLLCRLDDATVFGHTACHSVAFSTADNRGTTATGDWDLNHYKGECGTNEYVAGTSQSIDLKMHAIECCTGAVVHDDCAAVVMNGQDAQEDPGGSDWDPGFWKGECGAGRYVAGVSQVSGAPHAILCCGAHADAGLPDASVSADAAEEESDASSPPADFDAAESADATAEGSGSDASIIAVADGGSASARDSGWSATVSSGCSCEATPGVPGASALLLLLGLALIKGRRGDWR